MQLLNTLYVLTQGSYLHKNGENVVVSMQRTEMIRVPIHRLFGIACFGNISISPFLIQLCSDRGVSLSFLSERGRFLGRFEGLASNAALLRREQYRKKDGSEFVVGLCKAIVAGKIANTRQLVMRYARERKGEAASTLLSVGEQITRIARSLEEAKSADSVRGYEGEIAALYFGAMDQMVLPDDQQMRFERRSRRPPKNPVNALLSFGYAILLNDCISAIQSVGLDPWVGYLHVEHPGRPSLALDLMEEFRAYLVDRMVIAMINRKQIGTEDFETDAVGGVSLTEKARKEFLAEYQNRKNTTLVHPLVAEDVPVGLLPFVQARLLARVVRGDLDPYCPFPFR